MKKLLLFLFLIVISSVMLLLVTSSKKTDASYKPLWNFQAVDTMKYSRDVSREKLTDPSFDKTINDQVHAIAEMGATHVGIATPYDEEFLPILKRWVRAARRNNLKVWYRGNWSGWEGWFGYSKVDRATHIAKSQEFVAKHPELFEDGDVFSACPECENGGPGDPRLNGDAEGHKKFLISEYQAMSKAFKEIGRDVDVRYNSMNGDVAELIMDRETTKALGGIVVVDHYVKTPEDLASDVQRLADTSGGQVVLGEFGAPILDIHGPMTEDEQQQWLQEAMEKLVTVRPLVGMSYWVNLGGSTSLYNDDGKARKAVETLASFYSPSLVEVSVKNATGAKVNGATAQTLNRTYGKSEKITLPVISDGQRVVISAEGYHPYYAALEKKNSTVTVVLELVKESTGYKIRKFFNSFFSF